MNPSIHLQLQQTGDETGDPPSQRRLARCGNPSSTGSLLHLNLGLVGPAPPGKDKIPSPDQKSFLTATTPTNRGQNDGAPGRYRPSRYGNLNLGFVEPASPGEDKVPSPDYESFHTRTRPTNRGRKWWSLDSVAPRTVWKPQFVEPATPGEDKVQSADHKLFRTSTTPTYWRRT